MSYSVLIVEDDPMVAMINEQYVLKNGSFTVAGISRNGKEAVDFLQTHKCDLILLDVYMPVMDGIETLKKIRENKIDSEVIMITAANDNSTIESTMHLGVMDYLIKPFAFERFNISLNKFLSKKEVLLHTQVFDQNAVDSLITLSAKNKSLSAEKTEKLPKGIQQNTLNRILEYFNQNQSWQSVDIISEALGISVVTARTYLNFLVKEKQLLVDIDYSTGGRPAMLYRKP